MTLIPMSITIQLKMSDEGYEIFLMDLEDYKMELEEEEEE